MLLGACRGARNTKAALAFSLITLRTGRVPTVYYLAFVAEPSATGVWVGMALGNLVGAVGAVAAGLWFTRGTWKERATKEEDDGSGATAVGTAAEDQVKTVIRRSA